MKKIISLLLLLITLLAVQTVHAASTFTVTNTSGTSKFVITRTTNTSTTETVKYRTVSLSAIAGMHFTEKVGELTFDATHNSREVEVTETPSESVDEQYHFQTGTTRSYRFEVLDLGGFKLASCDRNITYGSTYQHSGSYVNKSVTDLVYFDNSGNIQSGSGNKYLDVSYSSSNWIQVTDAGYSNQQERSISTDNLYHSSSVLRNYLTRSYNDYKLYATVYFTQKEEKDGYQYIQIYTGNSYDGNDPNGSVNNPVNSLYKACFILSYTPSGSVMSDSHYQFFPHRYDYVDKATEKNNNISHYEFDYDNSHLYQQKFLSNTYKANTSGSLVLSPSTRNINVRFDAGGGGNDNDEWDFKDLKVRLALVDAKAPTTLAYSVAPGMHAKGNTVYVSVAFSEIVTGTSSKLTSNWGDLSYVAGSGSNVMTFSRTIPANASGSLNITGYSGITDLAGNAPSSVSASGICAVDASTTFTITYDLSGGSVATDPPTGYTWETAAFTLNNPVRPGYIFAGWTGSNGNTPQTTVTIPAGSHGNKAYTANWTPLWGQDDGKTGEDKDHAYVISSTDGLDMLAKVVNGTDGYTANTFEGKFFKLGADITYTHISEWNNANSTENNYTAIGRLSVNKFYTFMGTFDGGGYTVSGIRIYKKDATDANSFQGLFGRIGENGIVRNITLDDSRITGNTWSGGIAGNNVGTVDNCHVTDQVLIHTLSTGDMHGGIAGRNSGLLKNSTSAATLSANSVNAKEYGGIAGYNLGTVRNCLAVGTSISSQNQYVGAIVGVNDGGTLVSNYYRNCTVGSTANAINVGVGGESSSADQAGARSVHSLTLPTGVTATGESVTIGTDTYYARYTTVTLNIPTGSVMSSVSYNDGTDHNITGNTFTMPAADVTVSATLTDLWDITSDKDGTTAEKAYTITTTAGLDLLATLVNGGNNFDGKYFKLGADITYTNTTDWNDDSSTENNFTAIGGYFDGHWRYFGGTFDGQNHTVRGIRIYKGGITSADSNQGLFGCTSGATIRNVILADARITGMQNVGGIAGFITDNAGTGGIVENCRVGSDVCIHAVADNASNHGGVVGGCNDGTISGCVSSATLTVTYGLTGINSYGGIVGYLNGDMSDCLSIDASVPDVDANGAIAGIFYTIYTSYTLTNNYYYNCTVGGATTNVGVGYDIDKTTPHDCDGARSVHSVTLPTGVTATGESVTIGTDIYYASNTTVTLTVPTIGYSVTSYNDGADHNITGNTFTMPAADVTVSATLTDVWGIASGKDGTTAEKAYTITSTAGLDLLATLVNGGKNFDGKYFKLDADITYTHTTNWNDATSTENNYTAIGSYVDGYLRYFRGTFDGQGHTVRGIRIYKGGTTAADRYQGLFGRTIDATIRNVILADARITGRQYVGGIAGYITINAGKGGIVENCRVGSDVCIHAVVDDASYHGGVVGGCNGDTISGCVSSATLTVANGLTGINEYGGIVGFLNGDMSDCLSIDVSVTDVNKNGAIAGEVAPNRTLTNNYYYNCTVGGATTNVGIGSENDNGTPNDRDGACSVHSVTLPTGVTATGETVTNGTDIYYASNTTVTLNIPTGYVMSSASYNDGDDHDITDNTFTMPAADVTVTADYFMTWASLKSAMQNGGTFTLPYDITATETDTYLYVPSGKTVTLDLNGHTINRNLTAAANNGYVIGVDGTLTINDSSDSNTGSITGGNSTDKCGGVYVSGTFTMNGGTVTGNTGRSGGVYVSGTFTMNGGTVTGNTAISGGGVYVLSTFNMSGGTISNNSGAWGGGVYVSGTFTMNGGTISNNSGSLGGGVYVNTGQTINISGNPVITGNTNRTASNANNVYLESGMVITVTGALATGASIGVSMKNNTGVFTSGLNGNGTVANFTCDNSSECGVYLNGNGEASIIVDVWGIPDGADGTSEATAYTITTTRDLDLLAKMVNGTNGYTADKFDGKFFKLGNDITYAHTTDWNDATSIENNYTSIGFQYDKEFWGTFDGDGHTISGIRIYKGNNNCQGLFGYARGTVKNVTLSDARITGCSNVGGIVGYLTDTDQLIGTVNNCHVDGNVAIHTVVSNADYHGGIVGYSYSGTVINCTSQAVLTVADNLTGCDGYGGIVGQQYKGSVSSCLAIGATIPDVGYDKGAIAGRNVSGSLATNYYYNCTIGDVSNATSVGVAIKDINDNNNPEGAVAATILSESETVPSNLDGKVAFRREFTGGKASTICLPFALTDIEGGKAYEFVDVTYDAVDGWVATMNEVTATVANKPYLFLPEGSGSVPVLFHGTAGYDVSGGLATTSGDWTFTGTYTNLTYGTEPMTGHIYGFASKSKTVDGHDVEAGQFVHAKDGASVPPMRCYLTYKNGVQRAPMRASALGATGTDTDVPSRITVRLVSASGTVTAVGTLDTVTGEMDINTWYDMNGRLLETEPTAPGLYIHNGKTIMIMK